MTPTLASLFIGEWFGPAPTIIGIVLLAFWAWAKWSNRPVERLNFRFMGVVLLVISSSLWLGFEKGGASATGYGGDFGAFFAGRFADGWLATLAMFLVGLAALLSIPLATDWLFLPMFLKYRTKQGLAAAPVLGSVGGYKIVGAYAHEGSAPPAAPGSPNPPDAEASADAGEASATAVAEPDEVQSAADEPTREPESDTEVAPPPAAESDADLPWYMRRRPRGAGSSAPSSTSDELASRPSTTRTREPRETTAARFQLEPEAEPAPVPVYESRRRSRYSRPIEDETPPPAEAETPVTQPSDTTIDDDASSVRASTTAEPETYEETEADAVPSIDEIAQAPVAERTEAPEIDSAPKSLDAALDDAFAFADDAPQAADDKPAAMTIEEAAAAPVETEAPRDVAPVAEAVESEADADDSADETEVESDVEIAERTVADASSADDTAADSVAAVEPEPSRTTVVEREPAAVAAALSDDDVAFVKAGDLVVSQSKASISFLQKQLGVGYFQAAKLLDRLEKEKIIGPYTGGVNRDVLIDLVEWQAKKASLGA